MNSSTQSKEKIELLISEIADINEVAISISSVNLSS